jgi:hypothetical protein
MLRVSAWAGVGFALLLLLCVTPSRAHHAIGAKFDLNQPVTLSGTVTHVDWTNPHVHVFMDVTEAEVITNWAIELASPVDLAVSGWSAESLDLGESITVDGIAARDDSMQAWANSLVRADTGARVFELADLPSRSTSARPTPRWPDRQPRLGPPPGETGYWGSPTSTVLVEDGVNVRVTPDGLLVDIADAADVAPMQRWALGIYEMRQRDSLSTDPTFLRCIPPGGPRQFQLPYGIQFVEQRDQNRIFTLVGSVNRNWYFIYTDGRDQVGQVGGDDDNPLYYGRSAAHWEDDTFVVDTRGFNEDFWFTNGGLPHTDMLHLTQRITRPDFDTMHYEVTIDDPGAYTRSWTASWDLKWIEGEEMPIFFCQDNRP